MESRVPIEVVMLQRKMYHRCIRVLGEICNVTHFSIEISDPFQALRGIVPSIIGNFPDLTHMQMLVTQKLLFQYGRIIGHFLDLLSCRVKTVSRPATVPTSGSMCWEWLAQEKGKLGRGNMCFTPTDFDVDSLVSLFSRDLRLALCHDPQLVRVEFQDNMNDCGIYSSGLESCDEYQQLGMDKFFEEEDNTTNAAVISGEPNDAQETGSSRSLTSDEDAPHDSDNQSNQADEQDADDGADNAAGAAEAGDDGSEEGSEAGGDEDYEDDENAEASEQDDLDDDFEGESGSEYDEGEDDDDDGDYKPSRRRR